MLCKIEDCLETLSILSVTFLLIILKDIAGLYNSLLIIQESRYFEWLNCNFSSLRNFVSLTMSNSISSFLLI